MKKLIALLLAMVMVIGMLAGCSKKTKKKSSGSKKPNSSQNDDAEGSGTQDATSGKKEENKTERPTDPNAAAVTGNGQTLASAAINYYFVDSVRKIYNQYKSYFGADAPMYISAYLGIDVNQPLSSQTHDTAGRTWSEYLLDEALYTMQANLALCEKARAEGFQLPEATGAAIENNLQNIKDYAALFGYSSPDPYLAAIYGAGATEENYRNHLYTLALASAYYDAYYKNLTFTEAEIRQHGQDNFADCSDTQYVANVRHLLVEFEGGTVDSAGGTVYTDADKAATKVEAERLLQLWKDGAATEESFAALVKEHTDDLGSGDTGGLFENIHPESLYVEAFLQWSIDPAHKVGDVGIVETEYGYHIMYFVGFGKLTHRDYLATEALRKETAEEWYYELANSMTITLNNKDGLLLDITMASVA